ncbi:helix-turn-helix transcriptional regulator [Acidithiobacillus ferriphilus]|uniref:helix-turn-helix transcriptional regulator n=1 Tax=Acidithiobacillus ferriphilus TaxID=1689834 RepID=UPI003F512249
MKDENFQPRGLRAQMAAGYTGMSRSKFLDLVAKGIAPRPKKPSVGVTIWDKQDLDRWLDGLAVTK